jgi:2-oxoglutarate ferredoxin oxidoreductase subunit beta
VSSGLHEGDEAVATTPYTVKDYHGKMENIWCPGCGDFGVLSAIYKALAQLQLSPDETTVISGIGCSSRLPGYVSTYGFNSIHGRVVPIATGVKVANPGLTVLAVGGDGDAFSIGGGHIPHGARRNVDVTYVIMDNQVYGLTKGQYSATTPMGDVSTSTTLGSVEEAINPLFMCLAYGIGYVAQAFSSNQRMLTDLIVKGIEYPGFALINVMSPCTTFRGHDQFKAIKAGAVDLEALGHDPSDLDAALKVVRRPDAQHCFGLVYRSERASYTDRLAQLNERFKARGVYDPADVLKQFEV